MEAGSLCQEMYVLYVHSRISDQEEGKIMGKIDIDKFYKWDCGQLKLVFHYRGTKLLPERTQMVLITWHLLGLRASKGVGAYECGCMYIKQREEKAFVCGTDKADTVGKIKGNIHMGNDHE